MTDILKDILKELSSDLIDESGYEAANILLYTKDKEFFLDNKGSIRKLVSRFKKRIELRPHPSICMDQDDAKKKIEKILPKEAGVRAIIFDAPRSIVVIEAGKPGLAIGKQGSLLQEIRRETLWVPLIKRTPAIRSEIIENIQAVLYKNSEQRKKFLDQVGHRVYDGWIRGKKNEWIRITYLGGARQVGRSCLFLQTPESRILMDCGIDPSSDDYPYLDAPEFKIDELDAVILTHSHLDHCGLVPYLIRFGYKGPIYCTPPARDISALLQLDLVKIMRNEGLDPLYSTDDIKQAVLQTVTINFEEVTDITPDVRLTFYNAGHILGSAMVHLHIGNGLHNLLYTGDMKYGKTHLLDPAHTKFPRLETLMIESTYGGRDNILPPEKDIDKYFIGIIKDTIANRGKVLIPTLGSGRSQEVLIILEKLFRNKEIPDDVIVYIDGMVWDITAIHTAYPEYLNAQIRKQIFHKDNNPFLHPNFKRVGSSKERKELLESEGSAIIIATSGMLVGGPSVSYFKALAGNERNSLVFSCYQASGSLGARVQSGEKTFTFRSGKTQEIVDVKMTVHKLEISAHSDRRQLMNFVGNCDPRPRKIIVNHGENSRCLDLASSLHRQYRVETVVPRNMEAIRIK